CHFACQLQYWRLYLLSLVLGIEGCFQYGIQLSLVASPEVHIQSFVNYTWMVRYKTPIDKSTNQLIWSFFVAVLSVGCWAGAVHSGSLPVTYGRLNPRLFFELSGTSQLMVFSRTAKSFEMILLGRFLYGYNNGLGLCVHLMYLCESSPQKLRGFLTLTSSIFIGLGKVVGQIIGINETLCQLNLSKDLFIGRLMEQTLDVILVVFLCPTALQWLWQEDNLKMELDDMQLERERSQGEKAKTVKDLLTSRCVRWQLLTLAIPCARLQFCGINALCFYAFDIFRESGVPEDKMHYLAIDIGATELIAITLCSFLIDRAGRKKLMGYGYLLMGITMCVLTVMLSIKVNTFSTFPLLLLYVRGFIPSIQLLQDLNSWIPYVNITLIFCVICIYGLGPSGVSMVLLADLFLQVWRPSAYVVCGTINWLCMFVIGLLFGYIVDGLGQFCFLFLMAYSLGSGAFIIYFVPETKGKTMVEIMEDFNKLNYKNRTGDIENTDVGLETKF
ncbi:solute carrier family 2, facilitated glucose transporter member 11-like, partial [Haplochromis burtoni]|uniref:solute carrier family 2, facilitated glucose transporter member 11-like n=1 Tax=Haplochromis burtoni TaxID=8153 RepID=UPI001C2CE3B0